MPALQFENLPAAQTQKIRDTLTTQWQIEANALNKSWFSDRGKFETAKAKLNAKYQQMELQAFTQLQQQTEEQQRVQALIRQPRERTRGEEAQLRMELRPEAERLVFPAERVGRVPLSPTALTGYREFMVPFAEAAKEQRGFEWGTPVRLQEDLVKQYLAARSQAGYDDPSWTPTIKRQFDYEWDTLMNEERNYKWNPQAPEIQSLRPTGRLQRAATKNITPLGTSVARKVRFKPRYGAPGPAQRTAVVEPRIRYAQNPDTGARIMSNDGGKTWQSVK